MLFNSYIFVFAFLPVVLGVFYLIGLKRQTHLAIAWLVLASLFFYAWWNPSYLGLILGSMLFNYTVGREMARHDKRSSAQRRKILLALGVAVNLGLLGYYKYTHFAITNVNALFHTSFPAGTMVLPLAISFFTFQQITYLMDLYHGVSQEHRFLHYCLFVTFFPHLIAGPLVHHQEMLPQFTRARQQFLSFRYLGVGMTVFFMGLFKKVFIADGVAPFANDVFKAASQGEALTAMESATGLLAYTYQLYFDFSGYSDMAIGLALMFGIRLPLNFYSPYKAVNIIDFWSRWHMSLSRFLANYIYFPLGGNRLGKARQYVNIMVVMGLGGLWHGAAWGFVVWGLLHGMFLVINHGWRAIRQRLGHDMNHTTWWGRALGRGLTFICVMVGWAFFRGEDVTTAMNILRPIWATPWTLEKTNYVRLPEEALMLAVLTVIVFGAPNTYQIMARYRIAFNIYRGKFLDQNLPAWLSFRPQLKWAVAVAGSIIVAVMHLSSAKEFLYFRF